MLSRRQVWRANNLSLKGSDLLEINTKIRARESVFSG